MNRQRRVLEAVEEVPPEVAEVRIQSDQPTHEGIGEEMLEHQECRSLEENKKMSTKKFSTSKPEKN